MKKLERISRILIFVGFGIALLNNSVLGGSQTIGLIGMVFSVCSFSVYLYAKEKRKKQEKENDKQPLKDEYAVIRFPKEIRVIEEVTDEAAYKNASLTK